MPPLPPCALDTQGALLVLAIVLPVCGVLLAPMLRPCQQRPLLFAVLLAGLAVASATVFALLHGGVAIGCAVGGWAPPLGVALRADGLSGAMLLLSAVLIGAVGLYGEATIPSDPTRETRAALGFRVLLLAVWAGLNLVWVAADLLTFYVALELLTFAAVPLVCLEGKTETLSAALRYLLFALLGSVLYLVGALLLYGAAGTLDILLLAQRLHAGPTVFVAAALMTVGLIAKTALVPLHLWLPPAHAGAPPAASALLSALVVKGSFFLALRLWLDVLPAVPAPAAMQLLAALGVGAILLGNVVALRQVRLKLLIAYSTVAQIGYLFLVFPLARAGSFAIAGGIMQVASHATAKAAMFMAAGAVGAALGHDRVAGLAGTARSMPMAAWAFALGGAALIGLPPSGGFLAKWLLLRAAFATGDWWWAVAMLAGGLLTSVYVFGVLARMLQPAEAAPAPCRPQAVALGLAVLSMLLGVLAFLPFDPVAIGRGG